MSRVTKKGRDLEEQAKTKHSQDRVWRSVKHLFPPDVSRYVSNIVESTGCINQTEILNLITAVMIGEISATAQGEDRTRNVLAAQRLIWRVLNEGGMSSSGADGVPVTIPESLRLIDGETKEEEDTGDKIA